MKKTVFLVTSQIKNFIQTYNNQLKNAYKDVKDGETSYLVLLNEDLKANLKDDKKFIDDYIALAEEFKLPYTFFPYYGSFNQAMIKCSNGIPHPIFEATIESKNNKIVNLVHQISPGCIVLNLNMLKKIDFKFDTNYPTIFYLQDLVEKCYRAKLWISNCWYIDRHESWKDLKVINLDVKFGINNKNFIDEQKKYFEEHKDCKFKEAQPFIEDLRKWFKGEDIPVQTVEQVKVTNTDVSITVPSELVKKQEKKEENNIFDKKIVLDVEKKIPEGISIDIANNEKVQQLAQLAVMDEKKAE